MSEIKLLEFKLFEFELSCNPTVDIVLDLITEGIFVYKVFRAMLIANALHWYKLFNKNIYTNLTSLS